MEHQQRPAFTLIELLVVISIISLVIAILLPALQQARTAAHVSISLSNLRQLMVVHHLYANDHDSALIRRGETRTASNGNPLPSDPFWCERLFRLSYVSSVALFWSPGRDTSSLDLAGMQAGLTGSAVIGGWQRPGYGVNEWILPFEGSGLNPIRLDEAGTPPHSQILIMTETWHMNNNYRAGFHTITPNWGSRTIHSAPFTYRSQSPTAYLDGHAAAHAGEVIGWEPFDSYAGQWRYAGATHILGRSPWYREWQTHYQGGN